MAGVARLYREAISNSNDFAVYHRGVSAWLEGTSPYIIRPELEGFVFKYPPWAVPPLFWIGLFDFKWAAALWLTLCLAIVAYSVWWLITRAQVSPRIAGASMFLFWWIWLAHASAGQFTLILLGVGLWAMQSQARVLPEIRPIRAALLVLTFGAKVFSIATLWGAWRALIRVRPLIATAAAAILLHLVYFGVNAYTGGELNWIRVYSDWMASASSGSAELGPLIVRGQGNHGFAAGILRIVDPDAKALWLDFVVFAILTAGLGSLWHWASRQLSAAESWAGWMALGVIVLPLAWHHSFVVAFPLCAIAWDRAARVRSPWLIGGALLGTACIGIFIPQVIGKTLVKPLELACIKSWGVMIAAITLVLARQKEQRA